MEHFKHHHKQVKVLFVLKERTDYWGQTNPNKYKSSGLLNSATFIKDMLKAECIDTHIVEVVDANSIDREVTNFNADIVVLEAIWCTPEKLTELAHLHRHRNRKWIVRNHSELPFLAMEGISLQWMLAYTTIKNVHVSCNSPVANKDFSVLANIHKDIGHERILYLPNFIPTDLKAHHHKHHKDGIIDISCFGAVRPLKNHVEQAVGAIIFAKKVGLPLRFHINASRIEGKGEPVLKSLRAIFDGLHQYKLIEHGWLERPEFLKLCHTMDVGLQVSFSETFNIVSADHVLVGVPAVTSDEVPWMPKKFHADPTNAEDIADKIRVAVECGYKGQLNALAKYSEQSRCIWIDAIAALV